MEAKTEALARQFEGKARDAVATLEKLGDADWKKVTAAEGWTVGVTAHHLAGGLEAVAGIVTGIVSAGPSRGNFTRAMLDEMNAQHAKEHAGCTRAETLALPWPRVSRPSARSTSRPRSRSRSTMRATPLYCAVMGPTFTLTTPRCSSPSTSWSCAPGMHGAMRSRSVSTCQARSTGALTRN